MNSEYYIDYEGLAYNSKIFPQKYYHRERVKRFSKYIHKGKYFLDIGCGSGLILSKSKSKISIGTDIDKKTIKSNILNKFFKKNTFFVICDAQKLCFKPNLFDLIVCTHVIEHLEKPGEMIDDCKRILRSGGYLLLETPNYYSFWPIIESLWSLLPRSRNYFKHHLRHFTINKIKQLIYDSGLKLENISTFQSILMINEKMVDIFRGLDNFISSKNLGMKLFLKIRKI